MENAKEFIKDLQTVRGLLDGITASPVEAAKDIHIVGKCCSAISIEIKVAGKILEMLAKSLTEGDDEKWEEVPFSMRHLSEIKESLDLFLESNEIYQAVTPAFGKERWEKIELDTEEDRESFMAYVNNQANMNIMLSGKTKVREVYFRNPFAQGFNPEQVTKRDNVCYRQVIEMDLSNQKSLLHILIIRYAKCGPTLPAPQSLFYFNQLHTHLLTIHSLLSTIEGFEHDKK